MMTLSEATRTFIHEHLTDDVRQLALRASSLHRPGVDVQTALAQIAARQRIRQKLPTWYANEKLIFPPTLSLEQCSSEVTAGHKASLVQGDRLVDLTGGFGVDIAWMANAFHQCVYVERNTELCTIARHNFQALGLDKLEVVEGDGTAYAEQMDRVDCIYLDPARRSESGRKVALITDCEPNLLTIQDLLLAQASTVLIKLSPMLDIAAALRSLRQVAEVHVVSVANECKELLFLLRKGFDGEPRIVAINFLSNHDPAAFQQMEGGIKDERETHPHYTKEVGRYLYEPNASVLKAGFFRLPTTRYPVEKLHPDSHLYTSTEPVTDFPGRIFRVTDVSTMNKKELKDFLTGIEKANLTVRNFPLSVADLRKKLKLKEGGDVYLFATTLSDGRHVLIRGER